MAFTVASWNVEFFGSQRPGENDQQVRQRIERVFDYLRQPEIEADVYAIYEVNGAQVFNKVVQDFPAYSWQITEGSGAQLILIGTRVQAFITVKTEFSHGYSGRLRPGVLVTVHDDGQNFPMLFLHLKAADVPVDFGVRVDQHEKARNLRKALNDADDSGQANFIVAGDFNNVGLNLSFSDTDIATEVERDRLTQMYASRWDRMPLRPKTHDVTFWNGPGASDPPVDIDHVAAATRVQFSQVDGAEIEVKGWPEEDTDADKGRWIREFSDHALLRFTVIGAHL